MAEGKYIVFKYEGLKLEYMVMFPNELTHADVAEGLFRHAPVSPLHHNPKVVAAGFIQQDASKPTGFVCYGRSSSLNINSRPEQDARLAQDTFYSACRMMLEDDK